MRALAAVVVLALAPACGDGGEPPPSRLVGDIQEVHESDGRISAFTLEADGERWEIGIADDVDYGFDLDHLYEHRDTGDPVDVRLEERDGALVALQIDDA